MNLKTLLLPIGAVWVKLVKCLPAIVIEVEKAMADGKIDVAERKALALKTVNIIANELGFKLGWLVRWAISWLINSLAKKLPARDIVIPTEVTTALKSVNNS